MTNHARGSKSISRIVCVISASLCVAMLSPHAAEADAKQLPKGVLLAINQGIEGVAEANIKMLSAAMTSDATIIDEFAPYQWTGADSVGRYTAALKAWLVASNIRDLHVTAEEPRFWDVTSSSAWVSVPATFTFVQGNQPSTESGEYTIVLRKIGSDWKIKSDVWAPTGSGAQPAVSR